VAYPYVSSIGVSKFSVIERNFIIKRNRIFFQPLTIFARKAYFEKLILYHSRIVGKIIYSRLVGRKTCKLGTVTGQQRLIKNRFQAQRIESRLGCGAEWQTKNG